MHGTEVWVRRWNTLKQRSTHLFRGVFFAAFGLGTVVLLGVAVGLTFGLTFGVTVAAVFGFGVGLLCVRGTGVFQIETNGQLKIQLDGRALKFSQKGVFKRSSVDACE